MAPKLHHFLLLISAAVLLRPAAADDNACPYPCYPPPTGGVPSTPPAQPSTQTGYNYYPPPAFEYPSPTGNLPYYPPPSWYGGGGSGGGYGVGITPPPPDPILPYFPYYFKNGLHKDQSSSTSADQVLPRSTVQILLAILVFSVL